MALQRAILGPKRNLLTRAISQWRRHSNKHFESFFLFGQRNSTAMKNCNNKKAIYIYTTRYKAKIYKYTTRYSFRTNAAMIPTVTNQKLFMKKKSAVEAWGSMFRSVV
ncbi:hypothetical protein GQ600_24225 [Phytophthora cactorum]|nr:hypothetical protein GQ600_24225 [Phytophthora cactorum]